MQEIIKRIIENYDPSFILSDSAMLAELIETKKELSSIEMPEDLRAAVEEMINKKSE